ncbi:hypothetical protein CEUSTIGMA_g2994.t1 [Chlamydomonas eustigma]|uniref:Small ribosomal subunit protein mS29 n=1 Tax=Chlamydomonas eustigma TaxID=1157962 RepID=A0A250WXK7_9CHLO|nr:hypothetical protein CEUSTIGMA_g2994.t1 [Chlamydomonas eustigma]|eukprot:GAX75551.1 hypothetical protein CEUSTIGMA_g2994.t1 [Chlamydomonas eustigma]
MRERAKSLIHPIRNLIQGQAHFQCSSCYFSTATTSQPKIAEALSYNPGKNSSGSESVLVELQSIGLQDGHVGNYYKLQRSLISETLHEGNAGSKGGLSRSPATHSALQVECNATGVPAVMYRNCMKDLRNAIRSQQEEGRGSQVLLKGPPGTGKSVALASLVEWARASGWIAMYIPSATELTRGGYFLRRESSGQFDTINSAQQILRSLVQSHRKELSALPATVALQGEASGSLLDIANKGLATDSDATLAVDACMAIKGELVSATRNSESGKGPKVLFAIDEYNALYWSTGYGQDQGDGKRLQLEVEDLTLASGMRLLSGSIPNTRNLAIVGAESESLGVPRRVTTPIGDTVESVLMPRYSLAETAHALYWYWENGLASKKPSLREVQAMHALCNGNAKETRVLAPKMTLVAGRDAVGMYNRMVYSFPLLHKCLLSAVHSHDIERTNHPAQGCTVCWPALMISLQLQQLLPVGCCMKHKNAGLRYLAADLGWSQGTLVHTFPS